MCIRDSNSIADMFGGMKMQAIYMMIAGGVGLLAVGGWYLYDRRQRSTKPRGRAKAVNRQVKR